MPRLVYVQAILLSEAGLSKHEICQALGAQDASILHPKGGLGRSSFVYQVRQAIRLLEKAKASVSQPPVKPIVDKFLAAKKAKADRQIARANRAKEAKEAAVRREARKAAILRDPLKLMRQLDARKRFQVLRHIDTIQARVVSKAKTIEEEKEETTKQ